jgi:hypothetical protein
VLVIRFGTILTVVVVAMGLLVAGVLTGSLLLVYVAISVAVLAALLLTIGVVIWRGDVFGEHPAAERISEMPAAPRQVPVQAAAASNRTGGPPPGRAAGPPDAARRGGPPEWTVRPGARAEQDTSTMHLGPVEPAARPGRPGPGDQDTRTLRPSPAAPDTRTLRPSPAEAAARPGRPGPGDQDTRTLRPSPAAPDTRTLRPPSPGLAATGLVAGRVAAPAGTTPAGDQRDRPQPQDASRGTAGTAGPGQKTGPAAAAPGREPAASAGAAPSATATAGPATATAGPAGRASNATPAAAPAAATGDGARRDRGADVTVVPGIARYHRSDCILIRFLSSGDLETMALRDAEEAGCIPCKACRPEQELQAE